MFLTPLSLWLSLCLTRGLKQKGRFAFYLIVVIRLLIIYSSRIICNVINDIMTDVQTSVYCIQGWLV